MKDLLYVCSGRLASPFWQADKFVTWNGVDWVIDEERWMNTCAEEANVGKNMERWLGWTVWEDTGRTNLTPFMVDSDGKYILSFPNERYWAIVQRMIEIANYPAQRPGISAPGITICIDLAFQYKDDLDDIKRSPFRNNTLGATSLYDPAVWPYFEAYVLRWIAMRKKLHPITGQPLKIVIAEGNELLSDSLEFCYNLQRLLDRAKVWPFAWAICADIPSSGNDLFKELPAQINRESLFFWAPERHGEYWDANVYRPVHGCGEIRDGVDIFKLAVDYFALHPILFRASDDGCKRKPGAAWWYDAVKHLCTMRGTDALSYPWGVQKPLIIVEHLPEDCDDQAVDVYRAMANAYRETFGPLENEGQWPDRWTKPVASTDPMPTVPPRSPFNLRGYIANRVRWVADHWPYIAGAVLLLLVLGAFAF
jgi:hypothetical protein